MAGTLQDTVARTGTDYTIDIIRSELNTPRGMSYVWIVVEDIDDVRVYKKFVCSNVKVYPSTDYPAGEKGYEHVEHIVQVILGVNPNAGVVGIRDRDYTRFEHPVHIFPGNVFGTDERDVEMMLFHAPSVQSALDVWSNDTMSVKFREAIDYTRYMGYLRICNHICKVGCSFKRRVKLSSVWDDKTHAFFDNWKEQLTKKFLDNCGNEYPDIHIPDQEALASFIDDRGLDREPYEYVCQGHDTVWALSVLMVKNDVYSEANIMRKMTESYSLSDFQQTQLYQDIYAWAKSNNRKPVFNEE